MGNLQQNPNAITGLARGVLAGPVLQLFHDLQGVVHGFVALPSVDSYHRANTAGVVFPYGSHAPRLFPLYFYSLSIRFSQVQVK